MVMLWKRDQLDAVRRLMRERRYQEARTLLQQIDHPQARTLLAKLDARRQQRVEISRRLNMTYTLTAALLLVLAVVTCGLMVAVLNGARVF